MIRSTLSKIKLSANAEEDCKGAKGKIDSTTDIPMFEKSQYSDFLYYLSKRAIVVQTLSYLIFGFYIAQELVSGLIPNFFCYWNHDEPTKRMVHLFGYISLVFSPKFVSFEYSVIFIIIGCFYCATFLFISLSYFFFRRKRKLNIITCYFARYPNIILLTLFFPLITSFCGEYMYNVFQVNSLVQDTAITFYVLIFFIFHYVNMIHSFLATHHMTSLHDTLFQSWDPVGIIRLYGILGIKTTIYHIFPTDSYWLPTLPLTMSVISLCNFLCESWQTNWVYEWQERTAISAIFTSFLSSFCIFIDCILYGYDHHPKLVFWIVFIFVFIDFLFFGIVQSISIRISLKRLSRKDYFDTKRSEHQAVRDYCVGLRRGHERIFDIEYLKDFLRLYPKSKHITYLLSKQAFYMNDLSTLIHEMVEKLAPGLEYDPINDHIYSSLIRSLGPNSEGAIEEMEKLDAMLGRSFSDLIESIKIVFDLILNELTSSLPRASISFHRRYEKTVRQLMRFVQKYPGSADSQFYVRIFLIFFPNSPEGRELIFWLENNTDYMKHDISIYPAHFSRFLSKSDTFYSYYPEYRTIPKEIPNDLFKYETFYSKNQQHLAHVKGPYRYVIHQFFLLFALFLALSFPLVVMCLNYTDSLKFHDREFSILSGSSLFAQFFRMVSGLYPMYIFKDDNEFWDHVKFEQYQVNRLSQISQLQSSLMGYAKGIGPNRTTSMEMFRYINPIFNGKANLTGDLTNFQKLMQLSFIASDFYTIDTFFVNVTTESNQGMRILVEILNKTYDVSNIIEAELLSVNIFKEIFKFNPQYLLIPELVILIGMFFVLFFSVKNANSRFELFFTTLRETSKGAVTKFISDFQKCQLYISNGSPNKKKPMKKYQTFDFTTNYAIPLSILFAILIIFIAMFNVMYSCIKKQVKTSLIVSNQIVSAYINFSMLVSSIQLVQYGKPPAEKKVQHMKSIKHIYTYYQNISWFYTDRLESYCPACSTLNLLIDYNISNGKSFYSVIYGWLGMTHLWQNVVVNNTNLTLTLLKTYYFGIDEIISSIFDIAYTQSEQVARRTLNIQLAIILLYVLFALILVISIEAVINRADKPFDTIVRLLSRLPENALSSDTVRILNNHKWDFTSQQFEFDPLYYEQVLKTLPDPVIVIDKLMNILSYNNAALQIIDVTNSNNNGNDKPMKQKLFEALKLDLVALPSDDSYTNLPGFCDIVEDYLYDETLTILTRRIVTKKEKGKTQKLYFSLVIQPIDDDTVDSNLGQKDTGRFALFFKDISEEIRQQKMLEQEAEKFFQIINQILPAEIAHRLLHDQHSISFTVEKVAISFCDIVQFTPWCGSQPPEVVVNTLNHMFKLFDKVCAKYDQVTKIKCIGDCYMSAAGIFAQNQDPEIAAKQMVGFSLDLIDAIGVVNDKLGTHLEIRVGVAYGGPISAGVMGMHKPVFDIWGELVNDANAMESSGQPMKVHISSALYEIVKEESGITFVIGKDDTYFLTKKAGSHIRK